MPLVPKANNHFTAVEEPIFINFGHRIGLVPDKELEGIKLRVKGGMPLAQQIVAGENKNVTIRLQNTLELRHQCKWVDLLQIPFSQVIIECTSSRERDIPR